MGKIGPGISNHVHPGLMRQLWLRNMVCNTCHDVVKSQNICETTEKVPGKKYLNEPHLCNRNADSKIQVNVGELKSKL